MHSFHSAPIFIVYNSVICTHSILFPYFIIVIIVFNYTAYFVYSPQNSYVYIHWIVDLNIIVLLLPYHIGIAVLLPPIS